MSNSTDLAIQVDQLIVKYRNKVAVNRLSLNVPKGAVYALLGDNGMGKSTTMKVLIGQIRPDSGSARIFNRDCWSDANALRGVVGYVPDRPKLYDWMTVREIGWFTSKFYRTGYYENYTKWCDRLQIDNTKRIKDFSKGGYARVSLALALAGNPEVLLLDEPTSGLDLHTRREFLSNLVDLASEGRTILISSHSISELERFASHVGIVQDGQMIHASTLDAIRSQFLRVSFRYQDQLPHIALLGEVCQQEQIGRSVQYLLKNPSRKALDTLRADAHIHDYSEASVNLEDCYATITRPDIVKREGLGLIATASSDTTEEQACTVR